jgi:hypothetical protein
VELPASKLPLRTIFSLHGFCSVQFILFFAAFTKIIASGKFVLFVLNLISQNLVVINAHSMSG